MSEQEQRQIFSENLVRIIAEHGLTQNEIADAIGVSPQTFNTWVTGKAIPRMSKLQALADYFKVPKSALIDKKEFSSEQERIAAIEKVYEKNRILFDAAEDATPAQIKQAAEYLEWLASKSDF